MFDEKYKLNNNKIIFAAGCIIGVIFFAIIYGINVINVTNDSWLYNNADLNQHYIGWKFFRNSSFSFPIGMMNNIVYPEKISIIYTDSIPLFAVFFKLLSPILPKTFQYFGLFGCMCFALQGGIGALIANKYSKNFVVIIIFSSLLVFMPIELRRMFLHTALAAHFILLLALYIWVYRKDISYKKQLLLWALLGLLSVSIQMYFVPMVGIICLGVCFQKTIENGSWKKESLSVAIFVVIALITFIFLGGFSGKFSAADNGLGIYNSNLNTFFNPVGLSYYLKDMPNIRDTQWEGSAYLGVGIIILLLFSSIFFVNRMFEERKKLNKDKIIKLLPVLFVVLVSCILAYSNNLSLNNHMIYEFTYPNIIFKIMSIFRSSGRFIWIISYLIMVFIIKEISKIDVKFISMLLVICLIFQISDMRLYIYEHGSSVKKENNTSIISEDWNKYLKGYKHIYLLNQNGFWPDKYHLLYSISNYAVDNNMTMNMFYFARSLDEYVKNQTSDTIANILEGNVSDDSLYVFSDCYYLNAIDEKSLYLYEIDGVVVGVKNPVQGLTKYNNIPEKKLVYNNTINNGKITEAGMVLHNDGALYGPYTNLYNGTYQITIKGNNLQSIDYDSQANGKKLPLKEITKTNEEIIYQININEYIQFVEFRCFNRIGQDVLIDNVLIKYINR